MNRAAIQIVAEIFSASLKAVSPYESVKKILPEYRIIMEKRKL